MNLDDAMRGLAEELGRLLEDRFICFRKPIGLEELQAILTRHMRPWFDDYEKRSAEVFAGMLASGDFALAAKDKRIAELEEVLKQAAKWAMRAHACPERFLHVCPFGKVQCKRRFDEERIMQCWIEYWRKEAAPCQSEKDTKSAT